MEEKKRERREIIPAINNKQRRVVSGTVKNGRQHSLNFIRDVQ